MNAMLHDVPLVNSELKQNTAQRFSKAAKCYQHHAHVQQQAAKLLFTMLQSGHDRLLDLGAGPLLHHQQLGQHASHVLNMDLSHGMLQQGDDSAWRVCADMDSLPLQANSMSSVFSNFAIQWSSLPAQLFKELHRVCKPEAQLVISSVLDGSLKEIAQAWRNIDSRCHVNHFLTLQQLQRFATDAGFVVKTARQVRLKDKFATPKEALKSVKHIGANQIQSQDSKQSGLMGRTRYGQLLSGYPLEGGLAVVSYEVAIMELIKL
ncbi:methyltransferase domain-containing protein [Pseudoalteromonas sp. T1lg23B]|uniref:methyltransferase domain-containing protein n=1 Tax=Pseudoalteromonas sp. T1lg23B TaxID=2077097 RepID=UPI000CF748C8|nr:methyltransferase domain-containing protein [Pseudoalteromonas sp. T1lg23B]